MPINLIRWQLIYVRSGPVESRMVREEDFHPDHGWSTVEWFAECNVPRGWELESVSQERRE